METSPLEIRAEGLALLALGYSCRSVERRLRAKYPGAPVPRYNVINRWLNAVDEVQRGKRAAGLRWCMIYLRAAEILDDRLDELAYVPIAQFFKAWSRIHDIANAQVQRERA